MNDPDIDAVTAVLAHYGVRPATVHRAGHGLINATWIVRDGSGATTVLQRLHPVIDDQVNARINRLAAVLAHHDMPSPRVLETSAGELSVSRDAARWRSLTYIEGMTYDTLETTGLAHAAGIMLGRFHRALADPDALGALPHSTVHDLERHLAALRAALDRHGSHRAIARIRPLAERIFAAAQALPPVPPTVVRIVHGDPKISNVLFDPADEGICFVDLDTLGMMPLVFELGDAFRSWCNPAGEDTVETNFSLPLLGAAIAGYASVAHEFIDDAEVLGIAPAIETIYVELAARFCADALTESYFGWDGDRFDSATEHNLVRAEGQLRAALAVSRIRADLARTVIGAFAA